MDIKQVQKILGYNFKNPELLVRAFTLSSADEKKNNERLEFLGDSIVGFIAADKLFSEEDSDEGALTVRRASAVSAEGLEEVSKRLNLDKYLIRGVNDDNNKKSVSSVYEAVTAAIYLDGGMKEAKKFVLATLDFERPTDDPKSRLQVYLQKRKIPIPDYKKNTSGNTGSEKSPRFECSITLFGKTFSGVGESKARAQKDAAAKALKHIGEE